MTQVGELATGPFDPRASEVFRGAHQHLLPLFRSLQRSVDGRVAETTWRAAKYYIAASSQDQTFLAIKRQGHGLVIGVTLPPKSTHPRLADNVNEFNWSRISKVIRIGTDSDIDESLLSLVAQAAVHARDATRGSKYYGISLRDLLDARLLEVGERLTLAKGREEAATANVTASGEMSWEGRVFRSPSDRAFAELLGRQSLNGWTAWYVERPQGRQSLADLREHLQSRSQLTGTSNQ